MNLYERINNGVYVIAEMSANHGGSLENALKIVEEAKKAGADCLKIQTYTADTLTIDCNKECFMIKGGLWDGYSYYDLYKEAYTPWEWQKTIKEKCEEVGIDFLSTPFDKTAVDFLEDLGVEFYKVASYEMVDIPLIEYIAGKGKPIIMSCGMASIEEMEEAIQACKKYGNDKLFLLKCCSEYPADYADMNLEVIPDMQKRFGFTVGLSDHSMGSLAPVVAVALGAKIIEKHVRLEDDTVSADSGFSMGMSEFKKMVDDVRNASIIKGYATYELTKKEIDGRKGRRSLFAVENIKKGETFTEDNVRSIRPSDGLKPKYYSSLLGSKAKMEYSFGDPISEDEISQE
jgi:N-acetylneuraminate synthase/pseudaminic acid synthase